MASETWASLESAADPQGGPFTEEETGLMRRLCDDMAAADLAAVGGCKVKRFVRSHGLTNHKTTEKRYAATLKSLGEHVEWRRRIHLEDFLKPPSRTWSSTGEAATCGCPRRTSRSTGCDARSRA